MDERMADLVYPVITAGLDLKERLQNGERPGLDREQALLKNLLLKGRNTPEFCGYDSFKGARYALACWLDESFTMNLGKQNWEEYIEGHGLEWQLYQHNIREVEFWNQADLADAQQGSDALEVYYLCVMLGFRGQYRDDLDGLLERKDQLEARLARSQKEWPTPPERKPASDVPPLRAREQAQTMMRVACAVMGILILLVAVYVAMPTK